MGTWFAGMSARAKVLFALAVMVVAVGALTAGLALGGDDGDGDRVATGSSSTTPSSSSSSSTSSTSTTAASIVDTSTTAAAAPGATTATTKKPSGTATTRPTTPPTSPPATSPPASGPCNSGAGPAKANEIAVLFCNRRASLGLPAMTRTAAFDQMAQQWAEQLAASGSLTHRTLDDLSSRSRAACSSCRRFAENIGFNMTAQGQWGTTSTPDTWLGSEDHRPSIDRNAAGEYGVGAAQASNGYWYFVHNFGWYTA